MSQEFTFDGEVGTLQPPRAGWFFRFPSWVALVFAIPFLLLLLMSLVIYTNFIFPVLFGISSALFIGLWSFSSKVTKDVGLVRIDRKANKVSIVRRDGSEYEVMLGTFKRISIAKVIAMHGYTWGAFLEGESGEFVLCAGFTFRKLLVWRISRAAEWLNIPVTISDQVKEVDLAGSFQNNEVQFKR
ncbi:MAG: hypothetical protein WC023_03355 [Rhodocyclaceae bacterium]